jgi:hypothetical protein
MVAANAARFTLNCRVVLAGGKSLFPEPALQ